MTRAAPIFELSARCLAMLRAVAAGRGELTGSRVPDLYVDGRCCTDHAASALLVTAGLITPGAPGPARPGARVPARVTEAAAVLLATTTDHNAGLAVIPPRTARQAGPSTTDQSEGRRPRW